MGEPRGGPSGIRWNKVDRKWVLSGIICREEVARMFLGTSEHTLDDKQRLVLPKRDRELFGTTVILTLGFDSNLTLYPVDSYQRMVQEIGRISPFDERGRALKRIFYGRSAELKVDGIGRIVLPRTLLDLVGITKSVTLVGLDDHIEVWDTARFRELEAREEEQFQCLAQSLLDPTGR